MARAREKGVNFMQHVSLEKGKLSVKLNKQSYSRKAIEQAAKQFCNVGDSEISSQGNFFHVSLAPNSKQACNKKTGLLFCNFALAAMQTG